MAHKVIAVCDCCGEPLRVETMEFHGAKYETVHSHQLKEINGFPFLEHLCQTCALKIDNEILRFKVSVMAGG